MSGLALITAAGGAPDLLQQLSHRAKSAELLRMRLERLVPLSPASRALFDSLGPGLQDHRPGLELETVGEPLGLPRTILSGWACRMRVLPDGRQQVLSLLIPGDVIGLCRRPRPLALSSVRTLTAVQSAAIPAVAAAFHAHMPDHAQVRTALTLLEGQHEAYILNHVIRLGRQTAMERTASLLLELRDRLAIVGLGGERRFPLPLTQEVLANTLGLSPVHLNRTLQQLRRDRLIVLQSGEAELLDPEQLEVLADYEVPRVSAAVPPMRVTRP